MKEVTKLFLDYVKFDTQSDENSTTYPSTSKQLELLKHLKETLIEWGLDAKMDEWGYVTATLPTNQAGEQPKVCLIAHVDTSPAVSGKDVKARIVEYHGGDVVLNEDPRYVLSREEFPALDRYVGKHLIVTDGTTLLGADDKAGVAEIMAAVRHLLLNPSIPRPTVKIAFTPDEEVGSGVAHFDVESFGADFGYTVDGGEIGEINYECFNAASALVKIKGVSIHPGDAYGKMINAVDVFCEFHQGLPLEERPATTKGYQGFYMADEVQGNLEELSAKYIIRDHDLAKLQAKKDYILSLAERINDRYGKKVVEVTLRDQYRNMRAKLEDGHMDLVQNAQKAFESMGVTPFVTPIRGGTDGASLTQRGLPCPNLSAGGHNFHGRYEYIPLESLETMVDVLLALLGNFVK